MNFLIQFFNTILYIPLVNLLILLYVYLPGHDFGIAVIILTLITKLILFPSSLKSIKSQRKIAIIQPKIKEIQQKYKGDRQAQSRAMMELYQKEKVNPVSGCLPLLLQLPILIALYQVFLRGLDSEILRNTLYGFVPNPGGIDFMFLGIINLGQANIFLALVAGILQFFQTKISLPQKQTSSSTPADKGGKMDFSSMFQSQMLYFFPVITVLIVWKLGSMIGLYWITSTLFSIGEQYIVKKKAQPLPNS